MPPALGARMRKRRHRDVPQLCSCSNGFSAHTTRLGGLRCCLVSPCPAYLAFARCGGVGRCLSPSWGKLGHKRLQRSRSARAELNLPPALGATCLQGPERGSHRLPGYLRWCGECSGRAGDSREMEVVSVHPLLWRGDSETHCVGSGGWETCGRNLALPEHPLAWVAH